MIRLLILLKSMILIRNRKEKEIEHEQFLLVLLIQLLQVLLVIEMMTIMMNIGFEQVFFIL